MAKTPNPQKRKNFLQPSVENEIKSLPRMRKKIVAPAPVSAKGQAAKPVAGNGTELAPSPLVPVNPSDPIASGDTPGKLSKILAAGGVGNSILDRWSSIKPAGEFAPIPRGRYVARIVSGEVFNARTGTPGFKLRLIVIEGPYTGRCLWYDIWLTEANEGGAKRDLEKIAITDPKQQLLLPVREGIICGLDVVVHRDNDGIDRNRVKRFDLIRFEVRKLDPFAPKEAK